MSQPHSHTDALSTDVRRAVGVLLGFALLAVVLAGMYRNAYLFQDPFGKGLPDFNLSASVLTLGLQMTALLAVVWAVLLSILATPQVAQRLRDAGVRWADAERDRPRAFAFAAVIASAYAAARWAANEETVHATLDMFTAGTALTPFQYRALVPWLASAVAETVPHVPLSVVYGVLEALAAWGVYAAFVWFLRPFIEGAAVRRVAALTVFIPLALNLATPFRYNAIFFPYDTASVAFFTAGLALLLRRDWRWYYPLFIVATLNRETTCFLAVAYLLLALGRERPTRVALHIGVQAVLWLGIKVGLHDLYAMNATLGSEAAGVFSNQIARSGRILTAVPGLVYLVGVTMGGAGLVVALLWRRIDSPDLRRLFGIVPLFFAGMIVVGELLEVRIYSELVPLVGVALLLIARSLVREATEHHSASPRSKMLTA